MHTASRIWSLFFVSKYNIEVFSVPYPHIVAECMFVLVVLLLHGHVWGSTCCPEDLPEAMNDREKWRERVRDIRATSTT